MRRINSRHSAGMPSKSSSVRRASSTVSLGGVGRWDTFVWVEKTVCNELVVCLVTSCVYVYGVKKEFFCPVKVILVHMYHSSQIHQRGTNLESASSLQPIKTVIFSLVLFVDFAIVNAELIWGSTSSLQNTLIQQIQRFLPFRLFHLE